MARPLAAPTPRRLTRGRARPSSHPPLGLPLRAPRSLRAPRPVSAGAGLARAGLTAVWERRRLRIALLVLTLALALPGGLWLALRHSSLTAVEHVQVSGLQAVHGAPTGAIEAALDGAARHMSTLAVEPAALRAAAAPYPIVRAVSAHASFPHGLRIEVEERPPVAALVVSGLHTAVAADGVMLGAGYLTSALPVISAGGREAGAGQREAPAALPASGGRVRGGQLLAGLAVLGAAPAQLAQAVSRVYFGPKGVTVTLRGGVLVYFGDATRPHAKWLSLARVLADPGSRGATYVDVRLPERPAAGFAPGTAPPGASAEGEASGATSDPNTTAELAAGLDAAVGGGAGAGATAGGGTGTEAGASPGAGASTGAGAGLGAGAGASAGAGTGGREASEAGAAAAGRGSSEAGSSATGAGESGAAERAGASGGEAGGGSAGETPIPTG